MLSGEFLVGQDLQDHVGGARWRDGLRALPGRGAGGSLVTFADNLRAASLNVALGAVGR
jgi:hypothetical protein